MQLMDDHHLIQNQLNIQVFLKQRVVMRSLNILTRSTVRVL